MSVEIRTAEHGDLDAAKSLLSAAALPVDDLSPDHLAFVAESKGDVVGVIGIEAFRTIGLLRSLVVATDVRSGGVARQLIAALESSARERGVAELWLLTIDADAYFMKLGYLVRDRADAPAVIRDTKEFSGLCPGDAVLMSRAL